MPSQNPSTASASPSAAIAGSISSDDLCDVGVLVALGFRRQGMRAEEGGAHRDRPLVAEPARGTQRLRLVFEIEPVAGLDLDRGDAFRDQRVEPRQRLRDELVLARRAQRLDRRDDAAAGPRDLLVGRAGKPHLELVGAVAGMDQMGVAVDQAGRDPAALAVDDLGAAAGRRQVRFRTGIDDPAVRARRSRRARRCRCRALSEPASQAGHCARRASLGCDALPGGHRSFPFQSGCDYVYTY